MSTVDLQSIRELADRVSLTTKTVRKLSEKDLGMLDTVLIESQEHNALVDFNDIPREQFVKFWDGFKLILSTTDKIKTDWEHPHLILGLVSRTVSEQLLNSYLLPGVFLVRLSTSSPGLLTISYVDANKTILHVRVIPNEDGTVSVSIDGVLEQYKSLLEFVKRCSLLTHVYHDDSLLTKKML